MEDLMRGKAFWLIFQEKPTKLLIVLKESDKKMFQTEISRKINATFAHTLKILELMEKSGIVKSEKDGKRKFVCLTELGAEVAKEVDTVKRMLELAEIESKIEEIYSEVRGRLPAEIDREDLKREYLGLKRRVVAFFQDPSPFIALRSRRVAAQIDMILAEILGLPPGTEFTL
jgi:predicted transcriptional regulator